MTANNPSKKLPIELLCLALLLKEDMYGYQMSQQFSLLSGERLFIPEGTLYICMHKLIDAKLVTDRKELVGERGTRIRVYYHITDKGRDEINQFLEDYKRNLKGISSLLFACGFHINTEEEE